MGASNFARLKNAYNYYTILENEYDEDNNLIQREYFEAEDIIENTFNYLQELIHEKNHFDSYQEIEESDNSRNYPTTNYLELTSSKFFGDLEVNLVYKIGITSAYYEGANIDYDIFLDIYNELEEVDDHTDIQESIFEGYEYATDHNKGLSTILSKKAESWVKKRREQDEEIINNLLSKICRTEVSLVGTFSNGNSVYTEVKK